MGETGDGSSLMVDGIPFHIRTLTMLDRPYGAEINKRYKDGDPNVKIVKTQPKHIYTYELWKKWGYNFFKKKWVFLLQNGVLSINGYYLYI